MKQLYIVRHAKSNKDWLNISDIDRPLNEKGYQDAHLIGKKLQEKKVKPDLIVSSPAIRALTTGLIIAQSIHYSEEKILLKKNLYESSLRDHVDVISETDNRINSLMIFGHNPTFSQALSHFINKEQEMPTCAVAYISFNIDSWKRIDSEKGQLVFFISPKEF